uniref:Uncharacterized protein n=1 Tax=Aegilops tauschii subsp. strangulata TaxID=200361 RepID=A0A452XR73_AEGTS
GSLRRDKSTCLYPLHFCSFARKLRRSFVRTLHICNSIKYRARNVHAFILRIPNL